jgi:hypothetical protein
LVWFKRLQSLVLRVPLSPLKMCEQQLLSPEITP